MHPKNILAGLLVFVFVLAPCAYAGKVELTTYYPSAYGEYTNLEVIGASSAPPADTGVAGGLLGVGAASVNGNAQIKMGFLSGSYTWLQSYGSVPFSINPLGNNVGFGTTNPGAYTIAVNGNPGANGYTAFTNYSDIRLKENVRSLDDGILWKIMRLKPSTFNYNEKYFKVTGYSNNIKNRKLCGFIAQDLEGVFPEMVTEQKIASESFLDSNLTNLQIYLVKAIQEQQNQIQQWKKEIDDSRSELQTQLELLKKEIAELKKLKSLKEKTGKV